MPEVKVNLLAGANQKTLADWVGSITQKMGGIM
jgi:hypothetical protein